MFIKDKNYENFIERVRVNVGTIVGLENDEEAYITLKELPTVEMMRLRDAYEKGEEELMLFFKELLPVIIIDHNFYLSETEKMSTEELSSLIFEKPDLTSFILSEYSSAAFFSPEKRKGRK